MSNIVFFQYFCHYCKRTVVTVINAVFFYYLATSLCRCLKQLSAQGPVSRKTR